VVGPDELMGEHWFELEPAEGATVLRYTIEGRAVGKYEAIWRERIEPLHNRILEALLDNVEAAVGRPPRPPGGLSGRRLGQGR
jgi:carbon monoxide dehydrogenase subunit G